MFSCLCCFRLQDFVPTRQDILHSRKATKGILEHTIDIKNVPFRFVDVGGQRSQRQKWFQCFEGVTSILFLVSSSEFDQVLMEDRQTNRLVESCNIFDTIVNHKYFANVSIILFLNKTDLLENKIKYVSIQRWFPNFQGNSADLNTVQAFILNMFDMRRRERSKALFHHFTTAVDTQNIKYVFNAVRDTILEENLKRLMLQWCRILYFFSFFYIQCCTMCTNSCNSYFCTITSLCYMFGYFTEFVNLLGDFKSFYKYMHIYLIWASKTGLTSGISHFWSDFTFIGYL